MAATDDRNAGTNAGRIRGQINQISNWMAGADFEHVPGDDIDRVIAQVDWRSQIDPTLSASANYERIKEELGLRTATDIKLEARKADDKAADSARRALRENLEAIEAGEAGELVQDIREAFGEAFVEAELERARVDRDGLARDAEAGAPEPNEHNPSAVAHANLTGGATADSLEITHTPEPDDALTADAPAQASLSDATPDAEPEPAVGRASAYADPSVPDYARSRATRVASHLPEPIRTVVIMLLVFLRYSPEYPDGSGVSPA